MAAGVVRPLRRCLALLLALVFLTSCLTIPAAASQLSQPPRPLESFSKPRPLVLDHDEASAAAAGRGKQQAPSELQLGRGCTYTVKVKTSCASPARSTDAVSLAFGDAYRNEVYVAQLTPPRTGFQRCATDTFRVSGPCGYGVCYLYLRRDAYGRGGGWAPEWVRVYEPTSSTPSTFYYGDDVIPAGVWYGFDRCISLAATAGDGDAASSSSSSVAAAAQSI